MTDRTSQPTAAELGDAITRARLLDDQVSTEARTAPWWWSDGRRLPAGPGPDPDADRLADHALWRYALHLWDVSLGATQPDPRLLQDARDRWQATGRPTTPTGASDLQPAEVLAIRRLRIIADRAAIHRPLCPELQTAGEHGAGERP
jgi:hypothetical protein